MFELYLLLHLIPSLNAGSAVLFTFGVVGAIIVGAIAFGTFMEYSDTSEWEEKWPKIRRRLKNGLIWSIGVMIFSSVLALIVPDKSTLIYIYGGHYVTTIKDIEKVPADLVQLIRKQIAENDTKENRQ